MAERKPIYSMSGVEMTVTDADRVLIIIADVRARGLMSDMHDVKVMGPHNAMLIRDALREQGFEIVHSDKR